MVNFPEMSFLLPVTWLLDDLNLHFDDTKIVQNEILQNILSISELF